MTELMPNMGRDPRVREPPGVDHIFRDEDSPRSVGLIVWDMENSSIPPNSRHWAITWQVGVASTGDRVHRRLAITRERGPDGQLDHLTNWGPKTHMMSMQSESDTTFIPIATLTYTQRRWLEGVAAEEPVLKPNGWWNCQHWVVSVLVKCIRAGVLEKQPVEAVLNQAGWHEPFGV